MGKGEDDDKCISIVILEHRLWRKDDKQYHHRFSLYDAGAKLEYPNSMEIHTLELPKIPKNSDGTALWNWLRFISSKTQEEIMPFAEKDPVISKSFGKLMHMSDDLILRRRAEARDKFLWDQAARERQSLREGLKKGMAKGMEKGREEGMAEVALRMLRKTAEKDALYRNFRFDGMFFGGN